ncbi:uncharacterized protein L203_100994 [Cryptococcus depauperatus CBS 7841]|uniref:Uncharacterized protein n=1 Tax=Cryptococcus depauperatus CBS 7841 TaxID=1295531 RepID=A0A1E3I9J3_9TREE|nr:hypothetical protein L203_05195 [Cryptococcus depauperatus CBS 7841]
MDFPVASEKPKSWPQKIWQKCKEQPAVPVGAGATIAALLGASYHLRKGNRTQFNRFLRFRIYAQGLTVVALVIYGTIELAEKERTGVAYRKDDKIVMYPSSTPPSSAPMEPTSEPSALPEHLSSIVDATKSSSAYPLRKEERMNISEFSKRLREAETLQKEEDNAKRGLL